MKNDPAHSSTTLYHDPSASATGRHTKIVATLGPASRAEETLEAMIGAGVDVVRVNFSHGRATEHHETVRRVRATSTRMGRSVAVLGDLQGPKIRIERFADGEIELNEGDAFFLDPAFDAEAGTAEGVGVSYDGLPADVQAGDRLLLDDGRIVVEVERVAGARIHTRVATGGPLSNNKGINRQGGGLSAPAITDKDRADIELAAELDVDYLAVSFPREASDLEVARDLFTEAGGVGRIVAKIERAEAVTDSRDLIQAADAIMVARGDLGVEIGDAELPAVQKSLIREARAANVPVITATQMMESMITQPLPTRAEVFDVANAVIDGTDAVMLSAETATGEFPVEVVAAMHRICLGAERHLISLASDHRVASAFQRTDEAIAMATMYTANHLNVRAIAALTESGSTTLWMSRIDSGIPIYALTRHEATARRVSLYRGVYPVSYPMVQIQPAEANRKAVEVLREQGVVGPGDRIIITKGDLMGVHGGTNSLKIVQVGPDGEIAAGE